MTHRGRFINKTKVEPFEQWDKLLVNRQSIALFEKRSAKVYRLFFI